MSKYYSKTVLILLDKDITHQATKPRQHMVICMKTTRKTNMMAIIMAVTGIRIYDHDYYGLNSTTV